MTIARISIFFLFFRYFFPLIYVIVITIPSLFLIYEVQKCNRFSPNDRIVKINLTNIKKEKREKREKQITYAYKTAREVTAKHEESPLGCNNYVFLKIYLEE